MVDGHCASSGEVIFVDESTSSCPAANGSSSSPYCTLASAVNVLGSARPVIVILGGTGDRLNLATTGVKPVIIGRKNLAGDPPSVPAANGTAVQVSSDSVLLRDIALTGGNGSNSKGIAITNSASLTLTRVTVSLTTGLGIDAESGTTLLMTACAVKNNSGGGILLNEAAFDIENTTVTGNGPGSFGASTLGGILVNNTNAVSGTTQISSTTISNNSGPGLTCVTAITGSNILAFNNGSVQVSQNCGVTTCPDAGATCGAQ
jgi:Right handed beta helix region